MSNTPPIFDAVGQPPVWSFTWKELTMGNGIPWSLHQQQGLIAVCMDHTPIWIDGEASDISGNLGRFIGALAGATHLHPGGARMNYRWDHLPQGVIRVHVWEGREPRLKADALVDAFQPMLNL